LLIPTCTEMAGKAKRYFKGGEEKKKGGEVASLLKKNREMSWRWVINFSGHAGMKGGGQTRVSIGSQERERTVLKTPRVG